MGLSEILSRIEKDSESEAKKILKEAKEEADRIKKEAEESVARILSEEEAKGRTEGEKEKIRKKAQSRVEARKMKLENKRLIIDQIFKNFYEYINQEGYDSAIKYLTKDLPKDGILLFPKNDEARIKNSIEGEYTFRLSDEVKDGFVLKSGNIEYDCTFTTLLENIRERLEVRVVEILFGNAKL
jgi:V/A-type H+-transporting ATPase subunit E